MPQIEFEGKTTEEAIEKACTHLHLSPEELKFEIVSTGSSGIFGLGSKKARIRVTVQEKISARSSEPEDRPDPTRHESPGAAKEESKPKEHRRPERRPERRPPRRDEKRAERRPERPAEKRAEPAARPPLESTKAADLPLPPTVPGPDETVYQGPENEVMTQAREALTGILSRMGLEAEVAASRIGPRVILSVGCNNSGLLIGKKGATLDALQFLVNKIVNRTRTDKQRIIVDTEDYRQRRHQSLVDLAERMAAKARRSGRPVTIPALSAHDRRVVHLALHNQTGLRTRSRGDGPLKNLIIIPGNRKAGAQTDLEEPPEPPEIEDFNDDEDLEFMKD